MEFRPRNGFNLEEDDTAGDFPVAGDDRKRRSGGKRGGPGAGGAAPPCCQADACPAVLTDAKRYHRRHKVCEFHAKSAVVLVAGLRQRFCQQCSRFHELSEFDEAKRSCRRRLAGHNERRRKSSSTEPLGDGSTPATSRLGSSSSSSSGIGGQIQCRASTDENSRASGISLPTASNSSAAAAYKQHLQIG